ncbi:MAG: CRISPR-associated protein Csx16 [Pseudomonadota bacterium]
MTIYLVTRHPGAADWAMAQGHGDAAIIDHLDTGLVQPGDIVLGTLPVNLAADVCQRGGRYFHLSLLLPQELRGHELSAAEMNSLGAKLVEYVVEEVRS